ncbi:MAG: hypothetical protein ACRCZF_20505, partial [Gemmataceae bacterium]
MKFPEISTVDAWKTAWTGRLVQFRTDDSAAPPQLQKKVGRVLTITYSGRALVDFATGGWTEVEQFQERLVDAPQELHSQYDAT